jgi:hypothetical protein
MSQGAVKRWVLLMGVGGPGGMVAAAVFPPLAVVGILSVLIGGLGLTWMYSRSVDRWSWVVMAGVLALVFLSASVLAWDLWGTVFDLSDRGSTVPGAVKAALGGSSLTALLGLVLFVVIAVVVAVRAKRHAEAETQAL